ncbi:MAG: hypothetical protein MJ007_01845 [Paludibacteraceae bacterium]|nr:hypothetical protein [Paludibacteraceae bacterium]
MARIQSLDVLLSPSGKDYLAEVYGNVIENVMKQGISSKIKNTALSGNPTAGTVEAKRFENRNSKAYGTARGAGAGEKVTAKPVTVAINVDKELITEVENKDVSLYGVDNFIEKQAQMDQKSMIRELERAFWAQATDSSDGGTNISLQGTTAEEKAEELIQAVETVKNDFVDGVDRDSISLVLTPAMYGQLRTYIDKVSDGGAKAEEIALFHGVKVYSSVYLPSGVTAGIAIADGSIAQPVMANVYNPERVQLSNAIATGLFYSYGTKCVSPDLIMYA